MANFDQISHIFQVYQLLNLNKEMLAALLVRKIHKILRFFIVQL